jgi:hypothetical protein
MTAHVEPTREQLLKWLDDQRAVADEAVGRMAKAEAALVEVQRTINRWKACSTIELAAETGNPSLNDYMPHWEQRAEKAEARVTALEQALLALHCAIANKFPVTGDDLLDDIVAALDAGGGK